MSDITLTEYQQEFRELLNRMGRLGFIAHLVAFSLVNPVLIVVNFLYTPEYIWFFIPLLGWGIGLVMHYLFGYRWLVNFIKNLEANVEYRVREQKEQAQPD